MASDIEYTFAKQFDEPIFMQYMKW